MKPRVIKVPDHIKRRVTTPGQNKKHYIVVHETDNTSRGANADAHGRLQANGNSRQASWHYTVDDKEVVQSFSRNAICWAAGSRKGNHEGIQVEICVNKDGDFNKAKKNAQKLIARIMKEENIPLSRVVTHNYFSGKNCPRNILRTGFNKFKEGIKKELNKSEKPTQKPASKEDDQMKQEIEALKKEVTELRKLVGNGQAGKTLAKYVEQGKELGITDGSNAGHPITREQAIAMMVRLHDMLK